MNSRKIYYLLLGIVLVGYLFSLGYTHPNWHKEILSIQLKHQVKSFSEYNEQYKTIENQGLEFGGRIGGNSNIFTAESIGILDEGYDVIKSRHSCYRFCIVTDVYRVDGNGNGVYLKKTSQDTSWLNYAGMP